MILKIRQYIDCEYGRIIEDHIVENPKELTIQPNRIYSKDLEEKIKIGALFPVSEKECMCTFIFYHLDGEQHSHACWQDCIFIMSDTGKTIDRY